MQLVNHKTPRNRAIAVTGSLQHSIRLVILFVLTGSLFAQLPQRQLTSELLKDLRQVLADSLELESGTVLLHFAGSDAVSGYLNKLATELPATVIQDTITCHDAELQLTLNSNESKRNGNSGYQRQLKLTVALDSGTRNWSGKISDRISDHELAGLLEEDYPVEATGNFRADEPGFPLIIITALGTLSLVAALFFIRT